MRVLLVGPSGHGGEEVFVRTLLQHPALGATLSAVGSFHEGGPGVSCRALEERLLNRLVHPWLIPDLGFRALELRERFDLVHVHAHPVRLHGLGDIPLVMSEGSSSAVYLADYLGWSETRLDRAYARTRRAYRALRIHDRLLSLERVDRAFVFSHWARALNVRWGADPAKLDVVYPGFATPPLVGRTSRETFTFLFVGTDFERKGGFELIEAFGAVSDRWRQARLLLVCPDPAVRNPDRRIHAWVNAARRARALDQLRGMERRGVVERCTLLTRDQLYADLYPRADAFVMPSHAEGFGFTNVEAASFGLPVISSTAGAIPEIVRDGVSGLLLPAGDSEALAAAMERLMLDRDLAQRMGRAGREDFLARFTLERFRSEIARVYRAAQEHRCAAC